MKPYWKNYMVVTFIDEDNAPGVIPSNWCLPNEVTCYYPRVASEAMVKKRDAPKLTWQTINIRILHHYSM